MRASPRPADARSLRTEAVAQTGPDSSWLFTSTMEAASEPEQGTDIAVGERLHGASAVASTQFRARCPALVSSCDRRAGRRHVGDFSRARRLRDSLDDLRAPRPASARRSLCREAGVSSMLAPITGRAGEAVTTLRAGFRRRPQNCGVPYLRQIVRHRQASEREGFSVPSRSRSFHLRSYWSSAGGESSRPGVASLCCCKFAAA
jgi:hypothetical protein